MAVVRYRDVLSWDWPGKSRVNHPTLVRTQKKTLEPLECYHVSPAPYVCTVIFLSRNMKRCVHRLQFPRPR